MYHRILFIAAVFGCNFTYSQGNTNLEKTLKYIEQKVAQGILNYKSFERKIDQIRFQDNIVITMGSEVYIPNNDLSGAKAGETVNRRFTNIWMNKQGNWQQVARHASVICR